MKNQWLLLLLLVPVVSAAAAPDFFVVSQECKMLIASLSGPTLKAMDADPPNWGCSRQGKSMVCSTTFLDVAKPQVPGTETFNVLVDSPPHLYFGSDNGATFFAINTQNHLAAFTARLVDPAYGGAKVCTGMFITASELEILKKQPGK